MHPFLPVLSVVFSLSAAVAAIFLRLNGEHPEVAAHAHSVLTFVFLNLLIGGALAFWLRRFGLRFPSWVAILSLALAALLAIA